MRKRLLAIGLAAAGFSAIAGSALAETIETPIGTVTIVNDGTSGSITADGTGPGPSSGFIKAEGDASNPQGGSLCADDNGSPDDGDPTTGDPLDTTPEDGNDSTSPTCVEDQLP